jgi:hypothetical protein
VAAGLTIKPDGSVDMHLAHSIIISPGPVAASFTGMYAGLSGVVTSAGNIIAIGGIPGDPDANVSGNTALGPRVPAPSTITVLTGAISGTAISANMTTLPLFVGTPATATPLTFAQTTNANAGVYAGTHNDPGTRGIPSTWTFGVNADNSVHGFAMFLRAKAVPPIPPFIATPFMIDGTMDVAGTLGLPAGFILSPVQGQILNPGLVMTDQTGLTTATPGTFSGTIGAITGAAGGTWQTATVPPVAAALTTGSFTGSQLP